MFLKPSPKETHQFNMTLYLEKQAAHDDRWTNLSERVCGVVGRCGYTALPGGYSSRKGSCKVTQAFPVDPFAAYRATSTYPAHPLPVHTLVGLLLGEASFHLDT